MSSKVKKGGLMKFSMELPDDLYELVQDWAKK